MRHVSLALVIVLAGTAAAAPVTFPPDTVYVPIRCGGTPMFDTYRDQPGFIDDGDVVGTATSPAALRASDATNLYLRIRLDADPAPNQTLHPTAWGIEADLNGNHADYELLILVDGAPGKNVVELFKNDAITSANSPADPANQPPLATYPFADNARSVMAGGGETGTNPDFFLDFAVPWADLRAAGLDHATHTRFWAGSSTTSDSLNGDLACHDGASGTVTLDGTVSDDTTGDPADDPGNGSGSGSGTNGTLELEGGGGCSTTSGGLSPLVALALLGLVRRRSAHDPRPR
jgi:uncharacterized protein (TIGR03382 family)